MFIFRKRNISRRTSLPAYRIYWFNQDDHVTEADYLIAEADSDVRDEAETSSPMRAGGGQTAPRAVGTCRPVPVPPAAPACP
jgi:hypothetical protein